MKKVTTQKTRTVRYDGHFPAQLAHRGFLILCCILFAITSHAQAVDRYFYAQGAYHLCQAAHPANDFVEGSYELHKGYVDVSLTSKDNVFGGAIYTDLRVLRGTGDLYFSDILVRSDNDIAEPFDAFGLEAALIIILSKAIDQKDYDKIRNEVQKSFNTDFEHWTGKMWAVFALNLDYYEFILSGK